MNEEAHNFSCHQILNSLSIAFSSYQLGLSKLSHLKFYTVCIILCSKPQKTRSRKGHAETLLWTAVASHMAGTGGTESWVDGGQGRESALSRGNSWKTTHTGMCLGPWARGMEIWAPSSKLCKFREIHLTSLSLNFLNHEVITIRPTSQDFCKDLRKSIC